MSHEARMKSIELKIVRNSYGGRGIGHDHGKVVFVPFAVEGDHLQVEIFKECERYMEAKIVSELSFNPKRNGPIPCNEFGNCGGCDWQGIDIDQQILWKEEMLLDSFVRIGGFHSENLPKVQITKSPFQWSYRNRIMLKGKIEGGKISVGYLRRSSHEVVSITRCEIAGRIINLFLCDLKELTVDNSVRPVTFSMEIQEFPDCEDDTQSFVTVVILTQERREDLREVIESISRLSRVKWCGFREDATGRYFSLDSNTRWTQPGIFHQVNLLVNQRMRDYLFSKVHLRHQRVLDLYCGSGNLSMDLISSDRLIEGVEESDDAIECAKKMVVLRGASTQAHYRSQNVKSYLKDRIKKGDCAADLAILDPPRAGFKEIVPLLLRMKIPEMIIFSCDPTTLARDLKALKEVYRIEELLLFDLFPQTYHFETAVHLRCHT